MNKVKRYDEKPRDQRLVYTWTTILYINVGISVFGWLYLNREMMIIYLNFFLILCMLAFNKHISNKINRGGVARFSYAIGLSRQIFTVDKMKGFGYI